MAHQSPRKTRKYLLGVGAVALLAGLNAPAAIGFAQERYHEWKIAQPGYRAEYGSWTQVDIPQRFAD